MSFVSSWILIYRNWAIADVNSPSKERNQLRIKNFPKNRTASENGKWRNTEERKGNTLIEINTTVLVNQNAFAFRFQGNLCMMSPVTIKTCQTSMTNNLNFCHVKVRCFDWFLIHLHLALKTLCTPSAFLLPNYLSSVWSYLNWRWTRRLKASG